MCNGHITKMLIKVLPETNLSVYGNRISVHRCAEIINLNHFFPINIVMQRLRD